MKLDIVERNFVLLMARGGAEVVLRELGPLLRLRSREQVQEHWLVIKAKLEAEAVRRRECAVMGAGEECGELLVSVHAEGSALEGRHVGVELPSELLSVKEVRERRHVEELRSLRTAHEALVRENRELREGQSDPDGLLDALRGDMLQLQSRLDERGRELAEATKGDEKWRARSAAKDETIKNLSFHALETANRIAELESSEALYRKERDEARTQVAGIRDDLGNARRIQSELERQRTALEDEIRKLAEEGEASRHEIRELMRRDAAQADLIRASEEIRDELSKEVETAAVFQERVRELEQQRNDSGARELGRLLADERGETVTLRAEKAELERRVLNLQQAFDEQAASAQELRYQSVASVVRRIYKAAFVNSEMGSVTEGIEAIIEYCLRADRAHREMMRVGDMWLQKVRILKSEKRRLLSELAKAEDQLDCW